MPHFVETASATQTLKSAKCFHSLAVVDYSPLACYRTARGGLTLTLTKQAKGRQRPASPRLSKAVSCSPHSSLTLSIAADICQQAHNYDCQCYWSANELGCTKSNGMMRRNWRSSRSSGKERSWEEEVCWFRNCILVQNERLASIVEHPRPWTPELKVSFKILESLVEW
jgi:hypothetical protein